MNTLVMEKPTERYQQEYTRVLNQRKAMRQEHEAKIAADSERRTRTKRAIQHERASIFLGEKYMKKQRRLKGLLKNIKIATENNKEKIPKKLNMEFMYELMGRLIETHLLLSRGYKWISYHSYSEDHTVVCILKSLEHVAFKLDAMFQEPKVYSPWTEIRWKWYDLGFYIEFFISEMIKIVNPPKETGLYVEKKKRNNPFMKVSNHQYR